MAIIKGHFFGKAKQSYADAVSTYDAAFSALHALQFSCLSAVGSCNWLHSKNTIKARNK